jgi:hypothetical protein
MLNNNSRGYNNVASVFREEKSIWSKIEI